MCGICGAIQVEGSPRAVLPPGVLDRMTDAMVHRGPNDRGIYAAPGVALGVRRLSVVDVEGGHQPFSNEDGASGQSRTGSSTTTARCASSCSATGTASRAAATPRCSRTSTSATAPTSPRELRGMFGIARLGRKQAARRARARPARHQAALLRTRRRPAGVRLRAEEPARKRARSSRSSTTRRSTST